MLSSVSIYYINNIVGKITKYLPNFLGGIIRTPFKSIGLLFQAHRCESVFPKTDTTYSNTLNGFINLHIFQKDFVLCEKHFSLSVLP